MIPPTFPTLLVPRCIGLGLLGPLALPAFAHRAFEDPPQVGYDDTPKLPGSSWRVHDGKRPRPKVIEPPPLAPAPAPDDAIVLFDGSDLTAWEGTQGDAAWRLIDGAMEVNGSGDIASRETFGDIQLHLEWRTPLKVVGESQGRGNSGVFLMGRYEVQVLDSHGNDTYPDGQAAALYGQMPPLVNASRAPGEWQSYDIVFRAPRFEGEKLLSPARITVLHNGLCVQLNEDFLGPTAHRTLPVWKPHAATGPIKLQDHGNPVRYRNIWVRALTREGGS